MKREFKLLKNFGFLAIGNVAVGLISFLLLPLYTGLLSTSDYGLYELIVTTVSLLVPVVTIDIVDATLRFSMGADNVKQQVFAITEKYCIIGVLLVVILLAINHIVGLLRFLIGYELVFLLMFTGSAVVGVLTAYAKGSGKIRQTAISGLVGALVSAAFTVLLLAILKKGIQGFLIATILGYVSQIGYLVLNLRTSHIGNIEIDQKLEKAMRRYSMPLVVNNVAWWVNSALDRYILTYFSGMAITGIYSVSYKIPTVINIVQGVFHQAWTLSAIEEYDDKEAMVYFKNTYRHYNFYLVGVCGVLILFNRLLARFLYANDFFAAWQYVPWLSIGFVFLGLSNFIGGIFNAFKMSVIIAKTTVCGAAINVVMNLLLIPTIGAYGAALATSFSYLFVWAFRLLGIRKEMNMTLTSKRDIISYIFLLLSSLYTLDYTTLLEAVHICSLILLFVLYRQEVKELFKMARGIFEK